ncbi:pro-neuregulin-3, membrane-bound isoform isoform X1 [Eucyclogobius newberryi]|uniref:pro-neuregulin-3, membrane-bound isoform isoform X1 n=1 Tax=Eucyclogobius newberryi TaxID=166745 RepID=UPI003B5C3CE9
MSHNGRQGRMSEAAGAGAVILEEPEISATNSGARGESQNQERALFFRCPLWPRQQTWLCVVPLLIGFIGLGLSLMLLKWIVVGTVRDYVPTDLVDANRIGQDPIFLSKPSGIPKSGDTSTTTTATTTTVTTTTAEGGDPPAKTVGRARTRLTATTTAVNHRGGGAYGSQVTQRNPGNRNGRHGFTTTTAGPRSTHSAGAGTASSPPHKPTVLHDQTAMWTPEHTTTEAAVTMTTSRSHGHHKTPSPTVPPLHSEHFKPCHEKDLAYCLNGGECFVIETLSGPHKHCKCREGYQGIRCDQFLPKTDSILSDPNHLGIEFMESKDVYKRQVLSFTSITMVISLLGIICMTLYYRNKRQREKLQAHLKENRSLKNYNSHNAPGEERGMSSSNVQTYPYCKRLFQCLVAESSFNHCSISNTSCNSFFRCSATAKQPKERILFYCPGQKFQEAHKSLDPHMPASRRPLSIPRGKFNQNGGSKASASAYKHIQEVESSKQDKEAQKGSWNKRDCHHSDLRQDNFLHIQTSVQDNKETTPSLYPRSSTNTCSFRQPIQHQHLDSFSSSSIPIIPSLHCHYDIEVSSLKTMPNKTNSNNRKAKHLSRSDAIGQQVEVTSLLEEAQEHLKALAHCKHVKTTIVLEDSETICFLNPNMESCNIGYDPLTNIQIPTHSKRNLDPQSMKCTN